MTKLPAELEALMPEPAYRITGKMGEFIMIRSKNYDNKKGDTLYTSAQVREATQAATERAAKLCDSIADGADFVGDTRAARTAEGCAAAIRGAAAASTHEGGGKTP